MALQTSMQEFDKRSQAIADFLQNDQNNNIPQVIQYNVDIDHGTVVDTRSNVSNLWHNIYLRRAR